MSAPSPADDLSTRRCACGAPILYHTRCWTPAERAHYDRTGQTPEARAMSRIQTQGSLFGERNLWCPFCDRRTRGPIGTLCCGEPMSEDAGPIGAVDPSTLSRREDPSTSHEAAHAIAGTGRLGEAVEEALRRLRAAPGSTASELDPAGIGSIIAKRLNDLRKLGLARVGPARVCRRTGRRAQTWEPVG